MEADWKKWGIVAGAAIVTCLLMGLFWLLLYSGLIKSIFSHTSRFVSPV
jgi:hypothetical protein